jgi:iron complex outermembrane receptor protein
MDEEPRRRSDPAVQAYYDYSERDQPGAINEVLGPTTSSSNTDSAPRRSTTSSGAEDSATQNDRVENRTPALAFRPASRILRAGSVFAQNDVSLRENLILTLGLKLEYKRLHGVRVPAERACLVEARGVPTRVAAWSRAVRAPSRVDREFVSPASPPHIFLAGGPDFDSEVAHVYEVGYRDQITPSISFSLTGFHHDYGGLRSLEPSPAGPSSTMESRGVSTGVRHGPATGPASRFA